MADRQVAKSLEERVRWLEDRIQIEDVIVAAALFIDEDDYDRAASMYTDDATIDMGDAMGDDATSMSKQEFWARLHGMLKGMYINWHQVENFHIDVQDDTAKTISEVRAIHQVDQGGGVIAHFAATYYHTLVRTPVDRRIHVVRGADHFGFRIKPDGAKGERVTKGTDAAINWALERVRAGSAASLISVVQPHLVGPTPGAVDRRPAWESGSANEE